MMDYTLKIGGEAGQGIQTVGGTLAKVFSRSGFYIFTHQDYESRVRGGHNFYQVRISDHPVSSSRSGVDILIAMDEASLRLHDRELTAQGLAIYDSSLSKEKYDREDFLDVPFVSLAEEHGGSKLMSNSVAVGATLGMLGMDVEVLLAVLAQDMEKKGGEVVQENQNAARAGHRFASQYCDKCSFVLPAPGEAKLLVQGNDAIGCGAIAAGCRFYAAYPMTPSTGIMNYIAARERKFAIIVEQAEDEIAAINMVLGASFGGVRAMTGTSGGGFALMVEGLSLAAMTETPVVIALAQRPGPATGLPTRTEQGDLLFALYTAHGEFPRAVFAPGDPQQALRLTVKAFDLAEKYQIPAIIMTDQYLADSQWTFDSFELGDAGSKDYRLREPELEKLRSYNRHILTEDGVSPLAVPGVSRHLVVTDSDEHGEEGHIIEDAETRVKMVRKRLFDKLPRLREEIEPPLLYGSGEPDIVIVGWGSNYGVMREAVDSLSGDLSIAMLHFSELFPFPDTRSFDYLRVLENARFTICMENNASGQFARLMRSETGYEFKGRINKYDGRPFLLEEIQGGIHDYLK
jgi:2-oxoglutarate ferredoxin oxidoreductase subunit alpha